MLTEHHPINEAFSDEEAMKPIPKAGFIFKLYFFA